MATGSPNRFLIGNREPQQSAVLEQRQRKCFRRKGCVNAATEQICDDRRTHRVGHVDQLRVGLQGKIGACYVGGRTDTGRSVVDVPGFALASAMNSVSVRTPSDGATFMTAGASPIR